MSDPSINLVRYAMALEPGGVMTSRRLGEWVDWNVALLRDAVDNYKKKYSFKLDTISQASCDAIEQCLREAFAEANDRAYLKRSGFDCPP